MARAIGFTPGLGIARGQPADEAGQPRRHHGGRCLSVADPAPLCRAGRRRTGRRAPDVHAIERRPHRCAPLPGQGLDPVRAGGRHRRRGAHFAARGLRQDHRLRHGRHLDRRVALRRRIRARLRNPGRGRAHARADDEHPHGGRGRRLDPAFRRRALSRRAGFGRRQSRARLLSQGRAADGHRLQRHAGQDPAAVLSRRCSGRAATQPLDADVVRQKFAALAREIRAATGDARTPRAGGRGLSSTSPWATWPTRSSRFRCSAATT